MNIISKLRLAIVSKPSDQVLDSIVGAVEALDLISNGGKRSGFAFPVTQNSQKTAEDAMNDLEATLNKFLKDKLNIK